MGLYAERIFPWLLDMTLRGREIDALRAAAAGAAAGRVLEIGFGTGATLPFYTDAVEELIVLEPSQGMTARARKRIAKAGVAVTLVPGAGEGLPFPDAHFDAVVVTFTLCSVSDLDQVLVEVRRVLKPGGRFHFVEHVASEAPGPRRWQERLNPIQRVVGCGCNLNRETAAAITQAGLAITAVERRFVEKVNRLFRPLVPVIVGQAVKP